MRSLNTRFPADAWRDSSRYMHAKMAGRSEPLGTPRTMHGTSLAIHCATGISAQGATVRASAKASVAASTAGKPDGGMG
jgi:hypothetical protein